MIRGMPPVNRSTLLLILTVLFTAILGAGSLFAAEAPGVPISLEECLALAEAHHPALEEARAALAGQRARL